MQRMRIGLLVFLAACSSAPPVNTPSDRHLLDNARIIVGDGSVIENGGIRIEGGMIVEVGSDLLPGDDPRIDLEGATVIPALIDAHVHLGFEGFTGWSGSNYSRERVEDHLRRLAWYGFGAALTTGTDDEALMAALIREQEAGPVDRARVLFAPGVAPPGAGPNPQMLEAVRMIGGEIVHGVASADDAARLIAALETLPTDLIKIWVDDRGGAQPKLSPAVYRPLVSAAGEAGMRVIAHQQNVDDMLALLDAGAAGFLHGRFGPAFGREQAAALSAAGAFIVPNLGLAERGRSRDFADPFLAATLPPATVQRLEMNYQPRPAGPPDREAGLRGTMDALLREDADIVLGTDAGALPDHFFGFAGHQELARYVELGMTPMQALVAGTSAAARHLGLDDAGMISGGRRADLVVLDANPLADIRNTRSIRSVYLAGVPIDREALTASFRETGGPEP